MFALAFLIGLYGYILFFLGILKLLIPETIGVVTTLFVGMLSVLIRKKKPHLLFSSHFMYKTVLLLFVIIAAGVNCIGALGPELGFDALWYHLVFPKLYSNAQSIFHIPGGLLYYSTMPKLTEMLFIPAIIFNNEVTAKLLHFSFGILICITLYVYTKKLFTSTVALLSVIIFYTNLVVGWESITAYIDLSRTFFETLAFFALLLWIQTKKMRWFVYSALLLGLAISTKLLALGSLVIFLGLVVVYGLKIQNRMTQIIRHNLLFIFLALIPALPWFVFSYFYTGNPIYPFFTSLYPVSDQISFNPLDILSIFLFSSDPVSPLYGMFLPLVIVWYKRFNQPGKILILYAFLALVVWYITPRTGGGRFLLPYLPVFSIIAAYTIELIKKEKLLYRFLVSIVIIVAILNISYRGLANAKYLPVIFGTQTKAEFLSENLNFSFGDFYDTDGYFAKNIKSTDMVLLYGFHNLYYVDFPFIHESWVKKGDRFNYIAVQHAQLPPRFSDWTKVYTNKKTGVTVYNKDNKKWEY